MKKSLSIIILIIILQITIILSQKVKTVDEVFQIFNKTNITIDKINSALNNTLAIFKNYYPFYNILKDPPQPDGIPNYYKKLDIDELFNDLPHNLTLLEFSNYYIRKINLLRDLHVSTFTNLFERSLNDFIYIGVIHLYTKLDDNGEIKAYAKLNNEINVDFLNIWKDIIDIIKQNENIPIKYIKEKEPFDYIEKLYYDLGIKSPHGEYSLKNYLFGQGHLRFIPFEIENYKNISIIYENNISFNYDYYFLDLEQKNTNLFYDDEELNNKFINFLKNENSKILENSLNFRKFSDIIKGFNKIYNVQIKNKIFKDERTLSEITWQYEANFNNALLFQCSYDNSTEQRINVFTLYSFQHQENDQHKEVLSVLEKCVKLFDTNTDPLMIILNLNGGGNTIGFDMLELLTPFFSYKIYSRLKYGTFFEKSFPYLFRNWHALVDIDTCQEIQNKALYTDKEEYIKIDYGDNEEYFSKPFLMHSPYINEVYEIKKKIEYKRKPNEVLVFTDGFSFSFASVFTKLIKYNGAAMMIGYNGNPKLSEKIFDSGNSPTITIQRYPWQEILNEFLEAEKIGIGLDSLSIIPLYYNLNENKINIPGEFDFMPVDERSNIYLNYNDEYYTIFKNEAFKFFNKYKTKCFNNNKRFALISEECKFDNDTNAYGGYACGDNGEWLINKEYCIKVSCKIGFVLNRETNMCEKDPCYTELNKNDNSDDLPLPIWAIILIGVSGLLIITFIIIIIILKKNKKACFKKSELFTEVYKTSFVDENLEK